MSKATKRKHVTKEILEEYYVPEDNESIVKITGGRGNNLHEVQAADGKQYLVSMPTKFRRNVWVKRGDYVIVSPIKEGVKVQGEIVNILYAKQIKYLKEENKWPQEFDNGGKKGQAPVVEHQPSVTKEVTREKSLPNESRESSSEEDDDDDDLFQNPNHRPVVYYDEESDYATSSGEEECDEENGAKEEEPSYMKDVTEQLDKL